VPAQLTEKDQPPSPDLKRERTKAVERGYTHEQGHSF
jgi:hypothetical protein